MIRKLVANLGPDAWRALGPAGAVALLGRALLAAPAVVGARSLAPLDRAMRGRLRVRGRGDPGAVVVDLEAYRALDLAEGSMAFGGVREIWFRDVYLAPFALPPRLAAVIDLGANRGLFALRAAARSALVVAVEAQPKYRAPMERSLAANALANVRYIGAFVGGPGKLGPESGPTVGLQDVFDACAGHAIDLVKVDIEGSEFGLDPDVLARARRLALEVHPQFGSTVALVDALDAAGFECRCHDATLRVVAPEGAEFVHAINRACPEARWASPP